MSEHDSKSTLQSFLAKRDEFVSKLFGPEGREDIKLGEQASAEGRYGYSLLKSAAAAIDLIKHQFSAGGDEAEPPLNTPRVQASDSKTPRK